MTKIILHLCADIGSDSYYYSSSCEYQVIKIGKDIGVENYQPPRNVYGIIANPPCTEFSVANPNKKLNFESGMFLVDHCLRIIDLCKPQFWVLENPANGKLKDILGKPQHQYEPYQYDSAWTKKTALWGDFNMPAPLYSKWEYVPKIPELYIRPSRKKPSMAQLHKSAIEFIPEFHKFKHLVKSDMDFRSLCSQGFALEFFKVNR